MHDFNGGILPSGLFWTVPLDRHALRIGRDARWAVLQARDVPVLDAFSFGSPIAVPATMSLWIKWTATGPATARGSGSSVAPTDPAAFLGTFSVARSIAAFRGQEFGFSFRSDPGVSTDRGFAELGRERNGASI